MHTAINKAVMNRPHRSPVKALSTDGAHVELVGLGIQRNSILVYIYVSWRHFSMAGWKYGDGQMYSAHRSESEIQQQIQRGISLLQQLQPRT